MKDLLFSTLIELLSKKNDVLRKIDFAIIQLNSFFIQYFNEHPEVLNYSWEPLASPIEKLIYSEYPIIHIFLPPFRTTINYEQLISFANGNYSPSNIKSILIDLICKNLGHKY